MKGNPEEGIHFGISHNPKYRQPLIALTHELSSVMGAA